MDFGDMLRFNEYKELVSSKLDEFAESSGVIKMLSERTGLPDKVLLRYITTGLIMILLIVSFQALFSSMFCMVIPMYMSLKALANNDEEASKLSLNYWVLYAIFSILEVLLYPVIYFIPMWGICKCCIMFWIYSPVTQGGLKIMGVLAPLFEEKVEQRVDALISCIPGMSKLIGNKTDERNLRSE